MKNKQYSLLFLCFLIGSAVVPLKAQKQFTVKSPDGKLEVAVSLSDVVRYAVSHNGDVLLEPSQASMEIENGAGFGIAPKLSKSGTRSVDETIEAVAYKRKQVKNRFNELTLRFKGDYQLVFRVYDDGVAYRYVSTGKKPFRVKSEQVEYVFPADYKAYIPYVREDKAKTFESQFFNSFENIYLENKISEWDKKRYAFTPVLIEAAQGKKVCIVEADLMNYPGMYIYNGEGATTLKGIFAAHPEEMKQGGHNQLQELVVSRKDYLAEYDKGVSFPWRALIVSENDFELTDSDMVYKLATPAAAGADFSWVKPGKVAWDWWNAWNLYGVDFKAGINNQTYKHYIDFASEYGIEYVILDEGWAVNLQADLLQVVPEIDLAELAAYAESKHVGLILWAGYYAFNRDMENVCKRYAGMGIKGFKIDFMDRDDQLMVDFHRRAAETCARYKLLADFHGTYKPTGLQRTYPNVLNFEGVHGLEQMKWVKPETDQVTYDVTIPFIRMVAGPMDYTQGAMRNAVNGNYRPVYTEAMSQGTRCRQLAEYIVFESPLNMLCDNPSNYRAEPECTRFIASIPTVWDETKAVNGKVTEFVTIARKSGNDWYVGSLTNWDAREMELDLSFLGDGRYQAEVYRDGINADKAARDYKKETISVPADKKLTIRMAPGGGWVARIYKI